MGKADRISFGKNWQGFRSGLSNHNIESAAKCLPEGLSDLNRKTFLDVGCGSGIHRLAALRLGAIGLEGCAPLLDNRLVKEQPVCAR